MNAHTPNIAPKLITDTWGFWLLDPTTGTVVGRGNALGRGRVLSATRIGGISNSEWHHVRKPTTIVDTWGFALRDPETGTVVGRPGVDVQRCLYAGITEDTGGFNRA
jgi:hypothetical protein